MSFPSVSKLVDVIRLDGCLIASRCLPPAERARYWAHRYRTVASGRRTMRHLGDRFAFDNRFTPLLMATYLRELERLDALVGLRDDATVLDVGANVGQFAATAARLFPALRGWSFEPNPDAFALLETNLAPHPSWTAVPRAISAGEGALDLWAVPGKSAQGSVVRANAEAGLGAAAERRSVPAQPLTAELGRALGVPERVDLVKIDVEGAETDVLRGLAGVEWRYLAIEVSTHRRSGTDLAGCRRTIEELWGRAPELVWEERASRTAVARDVVLRLPEGA